MILCRRTIRNSESKGTKLKKIKTIIRKK